MTKRPTGTQPIQLIYVGVLATISILVAGCHDGKAMAPATNKTLPPDNSLPVRKTLPTTPSLHAELERLSRRAEQSTVGEIANAFGATSWFVPPPPPPKPVISEAPPSPPPRPAPPPLPFSYFGRYADSDRQVVILVKGDQLYTVSEGDTIDKIYRVERVAAGMVELTYLPLNIRQSVSTGGAS